jgi:HlyD family secretion protein
MNHPERHLVSSGAAMDMIMPQDHKKKVLIRVAAVALIMLVLWGAWWMMPRGLQVPAVDVRAAAVESGVFYDDIAIRAKAVALDSVVLDAVDVGRVEEIVAHDGAMVKKGDVLFRIANPQRNLELLQRQSELAQQISNLSNLRVDYEASKTDYGRRANDIEFNLEQALKKQARDEGLAQKGFISAAVLTESNDTVEKWRLQQKHEVERTAAETAVKRSALTQIEHAVEQIERGLALVSASVDALVVRASVNGRLTDFNLQVGASVKLDQHIGRIDDPSKFKLTAQVDEFYLSRVRIGQQGVVNQNGKEHRLEVTRILSQVTDGRFTVELGFKDSAQNWLSPGQSLDAQIMLGDPTKALLLPNAPFLNESGGAWAYVLAANGTDAERRTIRTGRRNNRQVEVLSGLSAGEQVIISSYASFGTSPRLQLKK